VEYDRSLRREGGVVGTRGVVIQSLMSSLSIRGILSDDAIDFANVLFPVPGCPFIAIITPTFTFSIFFPSIVLTTCFK